MKNLWKMLAVASALMAIGVFALQAQAAGDVANGEKCYTKVCAPCHSAKPGKMMGQPVDAFVGKLKAFKAKEGLSGKALQMQTAVKGLTDQNIEDVATYLNGLK